MTHRSVARGSAVLLTLALAVALVGPTSVLQGVAGWEMAAAGGAEVVTPPGTLAPTPDPVQPEHNAVPDGGRAISPGPKDETVTVWDLPAGARVVNPVSGRTEVIDPAIARSAVLFGDSQSAGAKGVSASDTWVEKGLAARGYQVNFVGAQGIGYVTKTSLSANYPDSVESGAVVLPYGNPALVVVQGGGNDAARGASDAEILAHAARLLRDLKASYPTSKYLFIGTLASGTPGGRRTQVDALLAGFAKHNGAMFVSAGDWLTRYGVANQMADGVHLTAGGHEVLAKVLAAKLAALQLEAPSSQ
ncbi:MAG: SGNH/GDSL hydrolase family protein [Specibacter sp.]